MDKALTTSLHLLTIATIVHTLYTLSVIPLIMSGFLLSYIWFKGRTEHTPTPDTQLLTDLQSQVSKLSDRVGAIELSGQYK